MDLVWYRRYKRGGGKSPFLDWEFSAGLSDWEQASAPAKVGKRLYEGLFQRELPARYAAATNSIMHWGYGIAWGGVYGILAGSLCRRSVLYGLPLGAAVWTSSYVTLPLARLYKPVWEYDAKTLAKDLSAHLAYGVGTAAAFALLARLPVVAAIDCATSPAGATGS
jgi:hypothetical protein